MRRVPLLLALLAAAVFPVSALAAPPANDEAAGAAPLGYTYVTTSLVAPIVIHAAPGSGGWWDATTQTDNLSLDPIPSCLGVQGFHSQWYSVIVPEASILTVSLATSTANVLYYQPVISIAPGADAAMELACGLGSSNSITHTAARASSYVAAGTYYVRIASASQSNGGPPDPSLLPDLTLTATLRDVTPPAIVVSIPAKIVGVGKAISFDAMDSTDHGSGIDWSTALWTYHDSGTTKSVPAPAPATAATAGLGQYTWKTPGLHKVSLSLNDLAGNGSTYDFFVYVHSFVPPKVSLSVTVPLPGARAIQMKLSHNLPINVRLVIFQGGKLLRVIPKKLIKGSNKVSKITIPLRSRVTKKGGEITISGMASTLGSSPNSVPLLTCAVDPVSGGGTCA